RQLIPIGPPQHRLDIHHPLHRHRRVPLSNLSNLPKLKNEGWTAVSLCFRSFCPTCPTCPTSKAEFAGRERDRSARMNPRACPRARARGRRKGWTGRTGWTAPARSITCAVQPPPALSNLGWTPPPKGFPP